MSETHNQLRREPKFMNGTCLKIFAGLLFMTYLLGPTLAHAGLFDALRSVGDTLSKISSSHIDEFKKLVESGKIEGAVAIYVREPDYFASLKDDNRRYVVDALGQRDRRYRAELGEARARLVLAAREEGQMRRWQQLKAILPEIQAQRARVEKLAAPGPLVTEGLKSLQSTMDTIMQPLRTEAPSALLDYGLFTEPAFPAKYPVAVRWTDHPDLAGPIGIQLERASIRQLEAFRKAYADTLIPAMGIGAKLNELYVAARLRESRANSYLAKRLVLDRLAKEGWVVADKAGGGVLLAVWPMPKSEVGVYQVRPPSSVRYQPFGSDQTPTAFIASGGVGSHELVVFLRHQPIRMERAESNERQVGSQYQKGTRRIQNPEYARAQQALRAAQDQLQAVRQTIENSSATSANSTLGAFAALIGVASESAAENELIAAQRTLQETPQLIEEPVFLPYAYMAKTTKVRQVVTTNYAIYDAGTGKVFVGSIERTWAKSFEVADRVHSDDKTFVASVVLKSTKAAQDWIKAPLEDNYEEIWKAVFSDYQKNSLGI